MRALADAVTICNRCGACQAVCPVYAETRIEPGVARGKVLLAAAILFIVLLFTGFFLFETLAQLRIHTLQYLLVGAALCIFYLSLLALSELLPFGYAYLASAGSAAALVTGYSAAVLGSRLRALVIALELALIYGFLYITLQLQDYALAFGSAGLFAALAVVMYTTRRVNWYEAR